MTLAPSSFGLRIREIWSLPSSLGLRDQEIWSLLRRFGLRDQRRLGRSFVAFRPPFTSGSRRLGRSFVLRPQDQGETVAPFIIGCRDQEGGSVPLMRANSATAGRGISWWCKSCDGAVDQLRYRSRGESGTGGGGHRTGGGRRAELCGVPGGDDVPVRGVARPDRAAASTGRGPTGWPRSRRGTGSGGGRDVHARR